jgi:hypothetical protein
MKKKITTKQESVGTPSAEEALPSEVVEAQRIHNEFERLYTAQERAEEIAKRAAATKAAFLVEADLEKRDDQLAILLLDVQITNGPQKWEALQDVLQPMQKTLADAQDSAAHVVNRFIEEIARGHQELKARAALEHFGDIRSARVAFEDATDVQKWLSKRLGTGRHFGSPVPKIVEVAQEVMPELARIRAALDGGVPDAATMAA